jgi:tubulin monoglycylase TTLL3/8
MNYISTLGTVLSPIHETSLRISNHLEGNYYLGYKKNMYKCLSLYYSIISKDISQVVPLTFHVKKGKLDPEYLKFREAYLERKDDAEESSNTNNKNMWILKPGENTNRGEGIFVSKNLTVITERIGRTTHTHIIQKYIEKPFLFERRKFDIRCFALVTSVNGILKAYYYHEGYLRTSSKDYSVHNLSRSVHLTNEAIQIKYEGFGKHEAGNKVSYTEFTKYLVNYCKENKIEPPVNFKESILPQIKVLVVLRVRI